ncbi:hypothetical protein NOR51B_1402 [Luminiphilus syltensis NOR5-1B]|uniref:Uncharacterized protein n=1 Tax=Luminiphilus syltensis NOR5-1B TaxID=565045 RepID=B8KYB7_9GAMM|nr:hypothetical protein NOR51B_1402 [Luminiphilus syltensis NOR5-1B]
MRALYRTAYAAALLELFGGFLQRIGGQGEAFDDGHGFAASPFGFSSKSRYAVALVDRAISTANTGFQRSLALAAAVAGLRGVNQFRGCFFSRSIHGG